jgi:error-prone DNA polymerase
VFCTALLNAKPMGFYAPAQIVCDAREHGGEVRPVCINTSRWDCTLEPMRDEAFAVRLGMRMVRGLSNANAATLLAARAGQPFASVDDLWRSAGVPITALVQLAEADAFREALGISRREALWQIKGLRDEPLPLFAAAAGRGEETIPRTRRAGGHIAANDRRQRGSRGLRPCRADAASPSHVVPARRPSSPCIATCSEAMNARDRQWLEAAGLVLVRQRPGSAKGVMFITIEDETGIANLTIWPKLFERQRRIILAASMFSVRGRIPPRRRSCASRCAPTHGSFRRACERRQPGRGFSAATWSRRQVPSSQPGLDPRTLPPKGPKARDIYIPDLHIDTIKAKPRDFR